MTNTLSTLDNLDTWDWDLKTIGLAVGTPLLSICAIYKIFKAIKNYRTNNSTNNSEKNDLKNSFVKNVKNLEEYNNTNNKAFWVDLSKNINSNISPLDKKLEQFKKTNSRMTKDDLEIEGRTKKDSTVDNSKDYYNKINDPTVDNSYNNAYNKINSIEMDDMVFSNTDDFKSIKNNNNSMNNSLDINSNYDDIEMNNILDINSANQIRLSNSDINSIMLDNDLNLNSNYDNIKVTISIIKKEQISKKIWEEVLPKDSTRFFVGVGERRKLEDDSEVKVRRINSCPVGKFSLLNQHEINNLKDIRTVVTIKETAKVTSIFFIKKTYNIEDNREMQADIARMIHEARSDEICVRFLKQNSMYIKNKY